MKNSVLILAFCALWGCAMGQNMLTVTLDATQLQNPDCWLNGGSVANDKVYFHSGLCTSNYNFCHDSIQGFSSPIWEHVTGNWGVDDGIGEMTYQGNSIWSISFDLDTYHGAPGGSTPYAMGLVFRNADGTFEGKDNQCGDIFIRDLNSSNPSVIQGSTGAPMPAVSISFTTTGVENPDLLAGFSAYPNPSNGEVNVLYRLRKPVQEFSATVYNQLGQKVAVLAEGRQQPGLQNLHWEASANGLYQIILRDGDQILAWEKVVVNR